MNSSGNVLIADDERSFLESTAELLSRRGYHCECVSDADSGLERLRRTRYDVMIADIRMPGNDRLRLVREAGRMAEGMPVILVTGYPSLETAIHAFRLPVIAYLKKPVKFSDLQAQVASAVRHSSARRLADEVREQLGRCSKLIADFQADGIQLGGGAGGVFGENTAVILQALAGCVSAILRMDYAAGGSASRRTLCDLLDCPQRPILKEAIEEAIEVLEQTKTKFKSTRLRDLRTKLVGILETV